MKRHGQPRTIVTDGLRSYPAALNEIGNGADQQVGRWLNNRTENSHQPFRRRERAMLRFCRMKTLQKFSSVHAAFHNHFNQDRHLISRHDFKVRRAAALAEWRSLATRGQVRRAPAYAQAETSSRWTDSTHCRNSAWAA